MCIDDQLRAVPAPGLGEQLAHIGLDGRRREVERDSDLLVGEAPADEDGQLCFSRGEWRHQAGANRVGCR